MRTYEDFCHWLSSVHVTKSYLATLQTVLTGPDVTLLMNEQWDDIDHFFYAFDDAVLVEGRFCISNTDPAKSFASIKTRSFANLKSKQLTFAMLKGYPTELQNGHFTELQLSLYFDGEDDKVELKPSMFNCCYNSDFPNAIARLMSK